MSERARTLVPTERLGSVLSSIAVFLGISMTVIALWIIWHDTEEWFCLLLGVNTLGLGLFLKWIHRSSIRDAKEKGLARTPAESLRLLVLAHRYVRLATWIALLLGGASIAVALALVGLDANGWFLVIMGTYLPILGLVASWVLRIAIRQTKEHIAVPTDAPDRSASH